MAAEALASGKTTEAAVAPVGPEEGDETPEKTSTSLEEDLEMMTSWVGGVEEAVALATEGGVQEVEVVAAAAWDASEMDLLEEARQTSENHLMRKERRDQGYS